MSATTFNEGSSRSHTILRLSIESSVRPDVDADPNLDLARTLSFLNMIDLAGSESAKAAVNKGHRTEGSYINKSLLTLGTVIAKLSDGNAVHIPFRDSKLTRLLQVANRPCFIQYPVMSMVFLCPWALVSRPIRAHTYLLRFARRCT